MTDIALILALAKAKARPAVADITFTLNYVDGCVYVNYADTSEIEFSIDSEDGCLYVDYTPINS